MLLSALAAASSTQLSSTKLTLSANGVSLDRTVSQQLHMCLFNCAAFCEFRTLWLLLMNLCKLPAALWEKATEVKGQALISAVDIIPSDLLVNNYAFRLVLKFSLKSGSFHSRVRAELHVTWMFSPSPVFCASSCSSITSAPLADSHPSICPSFHIPSPTNRV